MKSEDIGKFGELYNGDCFDVLKQLPDCSVTSICADPPAGIAFMNANWDKDKGGRTEWINWLSEIMKECLRVIKPGGMIAIWAIPRTSHWTMTAIEDAGFILRSKFYHHFGSGFPKSSSIPKSIDRKLGKERKVVGKSSASRPNHQRGNAGMQRLLNNDNVHSDIYITKSNSDEAKRFDGYGTSTKPSTEEWILAMAPLDGTYANNALKHGLAGINIDASRIKHNEDIKIMKAQEHGDLVYGQAGRHAETTELKPNGRWPADLILQHSPECVRVGTKKVKGTKPTNTRKSIDDKNNYGNSRKSGLGGHADNNGNETIEDWKCHPQCPIRIIGEQSGVKKSGDNCIRTKEGFFLEHGGMGKAGDRQISYGDKGTAARFFLNLPPEQPNFLYQSKPSTSEKNIGCENIGGNIHSTVKPLSLMKYLVTLLAPPKDALILDMFAGSGTTGVACEQLKIPFILIEKEAEYCDIIRARVEAANKPTQKKKIEKVKEKDQKQKGFFDLKKEGFV